MRLSTDQKHRIRQIIQAHLGDDATVSVFESRVDDQARGGDLDFFVKTPNQVQLMQRAAIRLALEDALSLPVDLLIAQTGRPLSAFQAVAKAHARPLDGNLSR